MSKMMTYAPALAGAAVLGVLAATAPVTTTGNSTTSGVATRTSAAPAAVLATLRESRPPSDVLIEVPRQGRQSVDEKYGGTSLAVASANTALYSLGAGYFKRVYFLQG